MKNEPFIQLFIEFAPCELQGATLWLPELAVSSAASEEEVVRVA
jgi:hypothetical protein